MIVQVIWSVSSLPLLTALNVVRHNIVPPKAAVELLKIPASVIAVVFDVFVRCGLLVPNTATYVTTPVL